MTRRPDSVRSAKVLGALLTGLLLGATRPADASSKVAALAVLPIIVEGPHGEASLSSVYGDVAAAANLRLGLRLISAEEIFVASSNDLASRVSNCGSDTSCIANRLRAFDARYGLVVVVNLALEPPLMSLQLLDTDERTMVAESLGELTPEHGTISNAVRARAAEVLERAGYILAGRIIVDATPPAAIIEIPGATADIGAPHRFTVAPGRYEVTAHLEGHHPASGVASAKAGEEVKLSLSLEAESSVVEQWWFWALIGVAAAGGATAAVLGTRSTSRCVCATLGGVGCEPCE